MKAIGYTKMGPIEGANFIEFETATPTVEAHDILVAVQGVSLNPVDTKVRGRAEPAGQPKILGYDAAGIVKQVGNAVNKFKIGDEVFYAGDVTRSGTNAELHVVDERIVGKKPTSLGFAEAAGMPLTSITAWELLFDSLGAKEGAGEGDAILVIGGAGGVGSMLIQLAKKLTQLTVIATASRQETVAWVQKMGADHVINHRQPIAAQVKALAIQPKYVAALTGTDGHFDQIIELIKPRGRIAFIDDPQTLDIKVGKTKALSFSWEFMFTRSMFQTDDMEEQQKILNRVSELLDNGTLRSTVTKNIGKISAQTLFEAHKEQESGRVIGKNVLDGFY
jgi:NADPH2:quinone reductase